MGALPADSEPVRLHVDEKHRLAKRVTREEASANAAGFNAFGQVRAGQLNGIVAHSCWSSRICARKGAIARDVQSTALRFHRTTGPERPLTTSQFCDYWVTVIVPVIPIEPCT